MKPSVVRVHEYVYKFQIKIFHAMEVSVVDYVSSYGPFNASAVLSKSVMSPFLKSDTYESDSASSDSSMIIYQYGKYVYTWGYVYKAMETRHCMSGLQGLPPPLQPPHLYYLWQYCFKWVVTIPNGFNEDYCIPKQSSIHTLLSTASFLSNNTVSLLHFTFSSSTWTARNICGNMSSTIKKKQIFKNTG